MDLLKNNELTETISKVTETIIPCENNEKWFALYVPSGKEEYVRNIILKVLDNVEVFIPKVALQKKFKGEIKTLTIPLFKGYIFVVSNNENDKWTLLDLTKTTDKIYKMLNYTADGNFELNTEDVAILTSLLDKERVLQKSEGIIIGDNIIIKSGPLVGKESMIKKINRHQMIATVVIEIMGRECEMKVPLEIVEKII